jgi:hypothetical protein
MFIFYPFEIIADLQAGERRVYHQAQMSLKILSATKWAESKLSTARAKFYNPKSNFRRFG